MLGISEDIENQLRRRSLDKAVAGRRDGEEDIRGAGRRNVSREIVGLDANTTRAAGLDALELGQINFTGDDGDCGSHYKLTIENNFS